MKILAFDSTAKVASVAIFDGDKPTVTYSVDNGLTQSELLLPMAEAALKAARLDFSDIEALAVTVGPGSFTGVRIGAALVKGIAFSKNLPCLAVSTLRALAENLAGLSGIVVSVMDARRAQVYAAIFDSDKDGIKRITEDAALPVRELCDILKEYQNRDIYIVGDGYDIVYKALADAGISSLCVTPPLIRLQNAASVASVAKRMLENGEYSSDSELLPTYLRLPQAERERLEKEKGEKK